MGAIFGTWPARHGVDGELLSLGRHHHDDFQEVSCPVGTDDQPTVRLLSGIFDDERMVNGVQHVSVGYAVLASRRPLTTAFHTRLAALGEGAEDLASAVELPDKSFEAQRRRLWEVLAVPETGHEIEGLVAQVLGVG
jgi:hypothetical protein